MKKQMGFLFITIKQKINILWPYNGQKGLLLRRDTDIKFWRIQCNEVIIFRQNEMQCLKKITRVTNFMGCASKLIRFNAFKINTHIRKTNWFQKFQQLDICWFFLSCIYILKTVNLVSLLAFHMKNNFNVYI